VGKRNQVRIIAGRWRRHQLQFPSAMDLRPTPDRVRETVFNWLGQSLEGRTCLDLFAGSGALGFEAASRAARNVVLVERDRAAHAALVANAGKLRATNVEVRHEDAFGFLATDRRTFDVVFLDPPYKLVVLPELLLKLRAHLAERSLVYLEADSVPEMPPGYEVLRQSRAGRVKYLLLESGDN
jgi:16S rRNA (guanine966-N2)-methyltransferase